MSAPASAPGYVIGPERDCFASHIAGQVPTICARSAGIVWIGTSTLPPALERIVRELNDELSNGAFPTERRPFQPHVTLARRCRQVAGAELVAPIAWRVESVVLNVSESVRGGVQYRALAKCPLLGREPDR